MNQVRFTSVMSRMISPVVFRDNFQLMSPVMFQAKFRVTTIILVLCTLLISLSGWSEESSTNDVVQLDVWHYWAQREGREAWQLLKEGFEEKHPHIKINLLVVPWNNPQKLLTAIIGGVPPDVTMIDRPGCSQWAERGALRPLNDLIERDQFDGSKFFESTWKETYYKGKYWVIPFNTDARAFYYNKQMFRDAGLDPESPPRNWKELKEYSDKLTIVDDKGKLVRLGFAPFVSIANYGTASLDHYAWMLGGVDFTPGGDRCTIASEPWVKALEHIVEFAHSYPGGGHNGLLGFASASGAYGQDPFITGKMAMLEHGTWYLRVLRQYGSEIDFGVAEIPYPEGGEPAFRIKIHPCKIILAGEIFS